MLPGATTTVHRHAGPELIHVVQGEGCMETPEGRQIGRPGGSQSLCARTSRTSRPPRALSNGVHWRSSCTIRGNLGSIGHTITAGKKKDCARPWNSYRHRNWNDEVRKLPRADLS